ncbi:MAG: hypothetical protein ACFCVF_05410 [Kineosporiaceae bacterium]
MVSSLESRARLEAVAGRQAGYVTAAQALACGYSHQAQWYHRDRGHWIPVRRGIVRLAERDPSPHERFLVAALWAGPGSVVSHFSAVAVHGLGRTPPRARAAVIAPARRVRQHDEFQVRVGEVPAQERQDAGGFEVTTPARTLADVRASRTPMGRRWLAAALERGLVTPMEAADLAQR